MICHRDRGIQELTRKKTRQKGEQLEMHQAEYSGCNDNGNVWIFCHLREMALKESPEYKFLSYSRDQGDHKDIHQESLPGGGFHELFHKQFCLVLQTPEKRVQSLEGEGYLLINFGEIIYKREPQENHQHNQSPGSRITEFAKSEITGPASGIEKREQQAAEHKGPQSAYNLYPLGCCDHHRIIDPGNKGDLLEGERIYQGSCNHTEQLEQEAGKQNRQ